MTITSFRRSSGAVLSQIGMHDPHDLRWTSILRQRMSNILFMEIPLASVYTDPFVSCFTYLRQNFLGIKFYFNAAKTSAYCLFKVYARAFSTSPTTFTMPRMYSSHLLMITSYASIKSFLDLFLAAAKK